MNNNKTMDGVYTGLGIATLLLGIVTLVRGVVETDYERKVCGNDGKGCITVVHKCDINSFGECIEFRTLTPSVTPFSETSTLTPLSYHRSGPEN